MVSKHSSCREDLNAIAQEADGKHPDDIDAATELAAKQVKRKPWYRGFVKNLVCDAVRAAIHDVRHTINRQIRRECGGYGGPAKVQVGKSSSVLKIMQSVFDIRIAGTRLGLLYGRDLDSTVETELAQSDGHLINADYLKALKRLVPANKQVQEAVTEKKLRSLIKTAHKRRRPPTQGAV